jgi:acetyl-CoA carboxylase biotin carboxylase subunit
MFEKILIANRGEIAHRLFRACHELGARTVAVYSEPDQGASWTQVADEGYLLPGAAATDTYLNQKTLLRIARDAGVDAIHPGYGFLSENASFAAACAQHGIRFIGPAPEAIRVMGSKATARAIAQQAGVPVIPGVDGVGSLGVRKSPEELLSAAKIIGFPVLIKAAAGGGGKGMRIVWSPEEFIDAFQAAQRESLSAFGDDHMLLEKYFTAVRHVEIQVLGDGHGNLVHLGERECSIQRRHQKIVEESPAPTVSPELRAQMAEAALALARAVDYESAGTVEFVLDETGAFYLLEMNTRLQVEHPVTELVTGIDLAAWQIRVAAGEPLGFAQEDVRQRGHAMECRVYAEDPAQGFMPSTGKLRLYRPPSGPGIRVDDGLATGASITPYYDPMLAKVITWGADRAEARRKMKRALNDTVVLGVTTNIPFLLAILDHDAFIAAKTPTRFLETHFPDWSPRIDASDEQWLAIAALEHLGLISQSGLRQPATGETATAPDPWSLAPGWRNLGRGAR